MTDGVFGTTVICEFFHSGQIYKILADETIIVLRDGAWRTPSDMTVSFFWHDSSGYTPEHTAIYVKDTSDTEPKYYTTEVLGDVTSR